MSKKYRIALLKTNDLLIQNGLNYDSQEAAQQTVDYLNSLIPVNLRNSEVYVIVPPKEEEDPDEILCGVQSKKKSYGSKRTRRYKNRKTSYKHNRKI